jgi:hypothetical protein
VRVGAFLGGGRAAADSAVAAASSAGVVETLQAAVAQWVAQVGSRCRSTPLSPTRGESESGAGGLTREVETPLPSNSPHDHMMLGVELVGSRGRWKRPCLQTAHMAK